MIFWDPLLGPQIGPIIGAGAARNDPPDIAPDGSTFWPLGSHQEADLGAGSRIAGF